MPSKMALPLLLPNTAMTNAALSGMRIGVTRPEEEAQAFCARLREYGAEPLLVPTIRTEPLPDPTLAREALEHLDGIDWLILTSAYGVRTVEAMRPLSSLPSTLRVAAIGAATAHALYQRGVRDVFIPSQFVGEALADELPLTPGQKVLMLRSHIARKALPVRLTARGAIVRDVPAYLTLESADAGAVREMLARRPHAITFTAPSAVRGFSAALAPVEWPAGCVPVAIGPITAEAIQQEGWPDPLVARVYTLPGMLDVLLETFSRP